MQISFLTCVACIFQACAASLNEDVRVNPVLAREYSRIVPTLYEATHTPLEIPVDTEFQEEKLAERKHDLSVVFGTSLIFAVSHVLGQLIQNDISRQGKCEGVCVDVRFHVIMASVCLMLITAVHFLTDYPISMVASVADVTKIIHLAMMMAVAVGLFPMGTGADIQYTLTWVGLVTYLPPLVEAVHQGYGYANKYLIRK
jgi:hypothetical protein